MRAVSGASAAAALVLCGCASVDDTRREYFIGNHNGESQYRYWTYRERDIARRTRQLCPNGAHEVAPRYIKGRDEVYVQGVFLKFDKIWVTISCPKDDP